jgi:hypothetical protein
VSSVGYDEAMDDNPYRSPSIEQPALSPLRLSIHWRRTIADVTLAIGAISFASRHSGSIAIGIACLFAFIALRWCPWPKSS